MTAMQRRKGASGERELFALLSDLLGYVVRRNIGQARAGGAVTDRHIPATSESA